MTARSAGWSLGAVAVGVALLASACGSSTASALSIVSGAAAKTTATHSARYELTTTVRTSAGPGTSIHASGVTDLTTGAGTATLDMDIAGHSIAMHEVVVNGTVYMDASVLKNLPGGAAGIPASAKWLKISGVGASPQSQGSGASELQLLRQVAPDVTKVGSATIRGTATTEYKATIDPTRTNNKVKLGATLQALVDAGRKALGTKPVPVEVWIDSSARLRRMTMTLQLTVASLGTASDQLSFDYYDFGTPVHITAPPANETFDLTSQLGGALSGLGASS